MTGRLALSLAILTALLLVLWVAPVFAGQASAGQLFFYPCTSCHPIAPGSIESGARKLPNGFKGHEIVLIGHDSLGKNEAACLACHEDADKNPGMLKTLDGSLVEITGDVSLVCARCHSGKYSEFQQGIHGRNLPKCTAAGCHDPHTPQFIYAGPLLPFVGTGFQFEVLPENAPFMPLPSAPRTPKAYTPSWFVAVVVLGVAVAGGIVVKLTRGRSKR